MSGVSIGRHSVFSHIMCGVLKLRNFRSVHIPFWDISVVLQARSGAPFESLASASDKILEATLLLALA